MAEKTEKNFTGVLLSPKDIRDYRFKKKVVMSIQYPERFELEKIATVKNQGQVGSCVAHAVSSVLEYHNKNTQTMSTNFLYGIHNKLYRSEGPGMYLNEACKIIKKYGDMIYDDCPGNTEVTKVYDIANEAFNDPMKVTRAGKYKIKCFTNLRSNDDIKYALMNHGPVLGAVAWYKDFSLSRGVIKFNKDSDFGYHATMIYGWNEIGWLCQNSWGKSWGSKGYYILPFEDKPVEAYSIVKAEDTQDDVKKPCALVRKLSGIINKILNK